MNRTRKTTAILACIATILLCGVSAYSQPSADRGIIDLRTIDFAENTTVSLDGTWEFYWEKLLSPDDFAKPDIPSPSYAHVPGSWNGMVIGGKTLGGNGYATYRLRAVTGYQGIFALKILDAATSYRMFVNGKIVSENGRPAAAREDSIPHYQPRTVFFTCDSPQIEIVVQVSNFSHRQGGLWESISIG